MVSGKYNFCIEQGSKFTRYIKWNKTDGVGHNLTGKAVSFTIKNAPGETAIVKWTTSDYITVNSAGLIKIDVPAAIVNALSFATSTYQLEITNEAVLLEGLVILNRKLS